MRPLAALGREEARRLRGLLFDLDDTVLDHGQLTEHAYSALFRLRESGLQLVMVTGRPAGWGEVLVRQWPIDAAVTENGALAIHRVGGAVRRVDPLNEQQRRMRRLALASLVADLMRQFPKLRPADDVEQRISDFTFDIGEHERVAPELTSAVAVAARSRGARTTTSSVHLHVSFESDDKASGAIRLLRALFGQDPTAARHRYAFIGDSENDATCFAAFKTTFAVRNLTGRPSLPPRYQTEESRGAGFARVAQRLSALRAG